MCTVIFLVPHPWKSSPLKAKCTLRTNFVGTGLTSRRLELSQAVRSLGLEVGWECGSYLSQSETLVLVLVTLITMIMIMFLCDAWCGVVCGVRVLACWRARVLGDRWWWWWEVREAARDGWWQQLL